jgi:acyl homoserine lactone synthase
MIRYLFSTELDRAPRLGEAMFRDRAVQFRDRMGWDVLVDGDGRERDRYDACDPLYVIVTDGAGRHAGSMRFLPTTGPTMLAEAFPHLPGAEVARGDVWECTRFCLGAAAGPETARLMLLGASELGLRLGLRHALGVFDAQMTRVYRRLGWAPEVLGQARGVCSGRWDFAPEVHDALCDALGLHPKVPRGWFDADLGHLPLPAVA